MVNELVTVDTVVRDGSTVCLRQASEADVPRVMTFLESLSEDSLYQRFMGRPALTPARVRALTVPPALRAVALVAEVQGQIVGFAGFYPDGSDVTHAEVAFAVADALQGHGIGTRLLERLASIARDHGIDTFEADVLGDNRRMLDVFRECGYGVRSSIASGVCHVTLSLSPTETFQSKSAARSRTAATASMRPFFEPGHVAVIGASRERGKIGSEILHNLIASGFAGTVAAVHPTASTIDGVRAYPRVTDIPEPIDLAIVVVPAVNVLAAVEDCITKKVRAICVISAGFAECGEDGRILEAAIVNRIRDAGCRLIGPNCMGLLNTDPRVRLNATFSPVFPPSGRVAMSTQSGALGLAILDYAKQLNIGISSFVSVGNKPDVSSNDLIQYWAEDPRTSVILLYLESFGNPRKFAEIARRVGRHKPIVAVKAGRSSAGARAASSHTGALSTGDTVVEALFRHAGVIRTARLEEMFDVATLLANQPLPRGNRVAILTNAGGPGILAADACEAHGLRLPTLSEATRVALRSFLPPAASVANPVDMLASAPADHYRQALKALLEDDVVDSVITIFIPPLVTDSADVAAAIHEAAKDVTTKPILGVFMRAEGAPAALAPVPCYAFPESAALALARVATYGAWRERPVEAVPTLEEFDGVRVRTIVDRVLLRGGGWTTPDETTELLKATGLSVAPSRVAADLTEALASASVVGYPVVLKALGPTLLHKTERQAVVLNITTATELRAAYQGLALRLGGDMTSVLVQQMIPKGVEMIVGAVHDPLFGPMIACGTGGTLVDVIADTAFRLPPLTAFDAREMVNDLRGARLLRGYRGSPVADEQALQDVLLRVSALVDTAPEIQELDLNPVIVLSSGTVAADARVRIEPRRVARSGRRVEY